MIVLEIINPGPLTSIQDFGRFGALKHGVAASGPMDRGSFTHAKQLLGCFAQTGLEIAAGKMVFVVRGGTLRMACSGGSFNLHINGSPAPWEQVISLSADDIVQITPGQVGNYAYVCFDHDIDVPALLGSRATNTIAGLGGMEGRVLARGDLVKLAPVMESSPDTFALTAAGSVQKGPLRFIWGLHARHFPASLRRKFTSKNFVISQRHDRMGVRLTDPEGVFATRPNLSLVSDAVVPGDIQILGDGTPIVLMRDHQPTGGYPRIGTIISADLDRFAQLVAGTQVQFTSVTVDHAHAILKQTFKG